INNFFFSSRRRHTRWPRDWSSDVCSSDLEERVITSALFHMLSLPARPIHDSTSALVKPPGSSHSGMKVQPDLDLLLDGLTVAHRRLVSPAPNCSQSRVLKDGQTTSELRSGHRSIHANPCLTQ